MPNASDTRLALVAVCISAAAAASAFCMSGQSKSPVPRCESAADEPKSSSQSRAVADKGGVTPSSPTSRSSNAAAVTVERGKFVFDGTPQPTFDALSEDAMVASVNTALRHLGMHPVVADPDHIATTSRFEQDRQIVLQWNQYNRFGALRVTAHDCAPTHAIRCIRTVEVQPRRELDIFAGPDMKKHTRLSYRYCNEQPRIMRVDCKPTQKVPVLAHSLPVQTEGLEWTKTWRNSLRSVVNRRASAIRYCYERALEDDPNAQGEARFELNIGRRGRVLDVDTVVDIQNGSLGDCAARSMKRWRFPRPDARTSALIGFRLSTVLGLE